MKVIISTINNAHKLNKCDLFMAGTNLHLKLINLLSCRWSNRNSFLSDEWKTKEEEEVNYIHNYFLELNKN